MKIKINYKFILIYLTTIIFFKPLAINTLPELSILNRLWDLLRILVSIIIIFKFISKKKITRANWLILGIYSIFFLSTILSSGDLKGLLVQFASVFSFCLLCSNELEKDYFVFFKSAFYALATLLVINFITFFIYPNGIIGYDSVYYNAIYFLASKNGLIKFIYPAIVFGLIYSNLAGKKIKKSVTFIIIISVFMCIYTQALTSLVGIIIYLLLEKMYKKKGNRINFGRLFFLIFIILIMFSILEMTGAFNNLIKMVVDDIKFNNFYARIVIWKYAFNKILASPFVGYGMPVEAGHVLLNRKYVYAHNGYFEVLLYGGVLAFSLFLILLSKMFFIDKSKVNKNVIIVCSGIIGFLVMMLTETHVFTISFWSFFVILDFFISNHDNQINNKDAGENEKK